MSEIFEALNKKVADLKVVDSLSTELFEEFLQLIYKVDNTDLLIHLINYSQLYLNENYEDIFINFVKQKIFDKRKNKNSKEIFRFCC